MQCLDLEGHHSVIIAYLDKLKSVDPYRQGYFHELSTDSVLSVDLFICLFVCCVSQRVVF